MNKQYKAIIFDLGNVIIDVSMKPACEYWSKITGRDATRMMRNFPFNQVYKKFEKGLINSKEFYFYLIRHYDLRLSYEDFVIGWNLILLDIYSGIDDIIKKLHKNFPLVVLSNTNPIHIPVFEKRFEELFTYFDKCFYSNIIHARKPEINSFRIVLEYLDCKPSRVLYFDDRQENIEMGKKLGLNSILVVDFSQMKDIIIQKNLINNHN